jgi:transposase
MHPDLRSGNWHAAAPMTPGRPVVLYRRVLDGILFVLRTGCQWKAVPAAFGSGSTCHRRFQQRVEDGIWARLWGDQLRRDDDAHRIGWYRLRKVLGKAHRRPAAGPVLRTRQGMSLASAHRHRPQRLARRRVARRTAPRPRSPLRLRQI